MEGYIFTNKSKVILVVGNSKRLEGKERKKRKEKTKQRFWNEWKGVEEKYIRFYGVKQKRYKLFDSKFQRLHFLRGKNWGSQNEITVFVLFVYSIFPQIGKGYIVDLYCNWIQHSQFINQIALFQL